MRAVNDHNTFELSKLFMKYISDLKQMNKFQKWQVIIGVMKYAYATKKETDVNISGDATRELIIRYENPIINIDDINREGK